MTTKRQSRRKNGTKDRPGKTPAASFWAAHLEALQESAGHVYISYTRLLARITELARQAVGDLVAPGSGLTGVALGGRVLVEVGTVDQMRAVKLVFPVAPAPFNRWFRCSWQARWSIQVETETRALWETLVAAAEPQLADVAPFEEATLFLRYVRPRSVDADAFDYSVKYLVDALVRAGMLAGDEGNRLRYQVEVVTDPQSAGSVELIIVEGDALSHPQFVPVEVGAVLPERVNARE